MSDCEHGRDVFCMCKIQAAKKALEEGGKDPGKLYRGLEIAALPKHPIYGHMQRRIFGISL